MRQLKISKQITNRDSRAVDNYLQDISKFPMVTPEEEVDLAKKIKEGDAKALEKLIHGNLRFVISVAKQYQNMGISLSDLINQGNLGLIEAAKRFDETRGFKFISYAVWWIRQSILKAVAEQSRMIRLPQNQIATIKKIISAYILLEQKCEREPSAMEIADELHIPLDNVLESLNVSGMHVSIDAPLRNDEDDASLGDILVNYDAPSADRELMSESLRREIARSLSTLSDRERDVIVLSFGLGMAQCLSLDEIGVRFNLSREGVRQIRERAIRRLRHSSRNRFLRNYLG